MIFELQGRKTPGSYLSVDVSSSLNSHYTSAFHSENYSFPSSFIPKTGKCL